MKTEPEDPLYTEPGNSQNSPADEDRDTDVDNRICKDSPTDEDQELDVDNRDDALTATLNGQKQDDVVKARLRRTRYLLTLKGRPPCSNAGVEMYERLTELSDNLDDFISHYASASFSCLTAGLKTALQTMEKEYQQLQQASGWLHDISDLLDKQEEQSTCTGIQVKKQVFSYLTKMRQEALTQTTKKWA